MERLQKVMADAGIASRRQCEQMIRDGLVQVNGEPVQSLPVLVDPRHDDIRVSGRKLRVSVKVYMLLNKPKNVVCTNSDPAGRLRAIDLVEGFGQRMYPIGRLDADSKGLLILTNDGELTNQLTHPRYGVPKTYIAEIDGTITRQEIEKLTRGLWFSEGKAVMERVKVVRQWGKRTLLEITLREGRNRQIRRMLAQLGHPVRELTRVRIGPLTMRGLKTGKSRRLTPTEVSRLHQAASATPAKPSASRTKKGGKQIRRP